MVFKPSGPSINEILTKNFLPDDSSDIVGGPRVFYQVGGPRSLGGPNLVGGGLRPLYIPCQGETV